MTVSILGCGWYGKALAKAMIEKGFTVKGSTTSTEKVARLSAIGILPYLVQFNVDKDTFDPQFFICDILIICIPLGFKKGEKQDYLRTIQRIIDAALKYNAYKVVYISSTGVYGDGNSEVNEFDNPEPDTEKGVILQQAENLFLNQGMLTAAIIRFGGLVGPGRVPGRFFAGKTGIPNGMAPVNLVYLEDCIGISLAVIEQEAFGHFINAVAPDHPPKMEFYSDAALQSGLPAPGFINELLNWKIVNSKVISGLLKYEFKVKDWKNARFDS